MISMDSANMHLSALVGTKVISIWGPTHYYFGFGPLNNEELIIEKSIEENTSPIGIIKATPWGLLFVFILAAISSIFVKKNEPVSDRIN